MPDSPVETAAADRLERFPPFHYMGVKVLSLSDDWGRVRMLLPLNRQTKNPGGSMFGGSVAAVADPVAALACHARFPRYAVWTRELNVDFRKPGMSDLELRFDFPQKTAVHIEQQLDAKGRSTPLFEFGIYDAEGELVAWVHNTVAIRTRGD